eukprot:scaffold193679_cov18-Tisochrysis_lutea.AAC.2
MYNQLRTKEQLGYTVREIHRSKASRQASKKEFNRSSWATWTRLACAHFWSLRSEKAASQQPDSCSGDLMLECAKKLSDVRRSVQLDFMHFGKLLFSACFKGCVAMSSLT